MLPHWLARELRTLFLSLCLWTFYTLVLNLSSGCLQNGLWSIRVNLIDFMCLWRTQLPMHHTVKEEWKKFFSSLQMTLLFWFLLLFFYIFLYLIMISDSEMPLFYLERLLFFVYFAYMYICMYAGFTVWCVSWLLGTVLTWARGRHCVFSVIYIKTWTFCHILTVANQTQLTVLCCYLEFYSLFPNCLQPKADSEWKPVINQSDVCFSGSPALWCGLGFCAAARSLCYSGKT